MGYLRSEEEVDLMIEEMKRKSKGKYITQGVTFNKDSERQMELLKFVLLHSTSFSGFGKELIAEKFESMTPSDKPTVNKVQNKPLMETVEKKDTGNFLL